MDVSTHKIVQATVEAERFHFERTFFFPDSGTKFDPGELGITKGVAEQVPWKDVEHALQRHVQGDWGDTCEEDAAQNDWILTNNAKRRLFSVFSTSGDQTLWIITKADRSATTVTLPEEY